MASEPPFNRRWPNAQVFVAENVKVLYAPIAKNGCSSLKRLLVDISDVPDRERILAGNVHRETDGNATGIQLKDHSPERAAEIAADGGYFRFVVLREPLDRLVSAYVEKMVINRFNLPNIETARPAYAWAQGVAPEKVDAKTGITFRQFAEYVLAQPPETLDPHWRPQSHYLAEIAYDATYTMEDFDLLQRDLTVHCGKDVALRHANRSRNEVLEVVPGAADMMPEALGKKAKLMATESFYDPVLVARVARYFALDATIHATVKAANEARRRAEAAEAAYREIADERPLPPLKPLRSRARSRAEDLRREWLKRLSLNGLRRAMGLAPVPRWRGGTAGLRKRLSLNGIRRAMGLAPLPRPGRR